MFTWYDWMGLSSLVLMYLGGFASPNPQRPTDLPRNFLFWLGLAGCVMAIVINFFNGESWPHFG